MDRRFDKYLTDLNCIFATYLDPRHKNAFDDESLESMRHKVILIVMGMKLIPQSLATMVMNLLDLKPTELIILLQGTQNYFLKPQTRSDKHQVHQTKT